MDKTTTLTTRTHHESPLALLREKELINDFDIRFGRFLGELDGGAHSQTLVLAAALTSRATRNGHICLDLGLGRDLFSGEFDQTDSPLSLCPNQWIPELKNSKCVGSPGDFTPLVLDREGRLYLHRYWEYQQGLARKLLDRAAHVTQDLQGDRLRQVLNRLSPETDGDKGVDFQRIAACTAYLRRLCIISGGPGTGKTTTAALVLALLLELSDSTAFPRIALAAPTGKSAARLGEAIRASFERFHRASNTAPVPLAAITLHRLLGTVQGSPYFRYHAANRLPFEVIVVDEASMVDLALMAKLVDAVREDARLILLGDHDQLASVEAGAVLGDICDADHVGDFSPPFRDVLEAATGEHLPPSRVFESTSPMRDCIVILERSYRFAGKSGLGALSRAINLGEDDRVVSLLKDGFSKGLKWSDTPTAAKLPLSLKNTVPDRFSNFFIAERPGRALDTFEGFRILCALREGPYGSRNINRLVEETLMENGMIHPTGPWYAGRPLLITKNNYELQLFNGDVGIILPSAEDNGDLRAFFPRPEGGTRKIHPIRLPEHETAFAMTVHKSQGSEFERVLLIFPDRPSPLLTRELLYTGITRAKREVEIWAPESLLRKAVTRKTLRSSGLRDALWKRQR